MSTIMRVILRYSMTQKRFYFINAATKLQSVMMTELQASRQTNVMRQLGITVDVQCKSYYQSRGDQS